MSPFPSYQNKKTLPLAPGSFCWIIYRRPWVFFSFATLGSTKFQMPKIVTKLFKADRTSSSIKQNFHKAGKNLLKNSFICIQTNRSSDLPFNLFYGYLIPNILQQHLLVIAYLQFIISLMTFHIFNFIPRYIYSQHTQREKKKINRKSNGNPHL